MEERQLGILLDKGDLRQSINSLQSFHKLRVIPQQLLPVVDEFGVVIMKKLRNCSDIR